ncbi:Folate-sensitive fragile site protein Fra10Ac1-domain-containing protein, partial [Trichostrongylus colubriformis]
DNHKFLWNEEDEAAVATSWEARMAKKYYDKLFKEYCIVDLTFFKKNKVAMRWRTEAEVRSGKGQFVCGAKKCKADSDLSSWEVNFAYSEGGTSKNALVKVRLCRQCSEMLNYGSQKRKFEKKKALRKEKNASKDSNDTGVEQKADSKKESKEETSTSKQLNTSDAWSGPVQETTRTIDDDIDEFLDDLFD